MNYNKNNKSNVRREQFDQNNQQNMNYQTSNKQYIQNDEAKYDDTGQQHMNYDYNYHEQYYHNQQPSYPYHQYEEQEEEEYEDDLHEYDECEFDPQTNKLRVTTFKSDKKPKHKTDPMVKSYQQTMKMIHTINRNNNYHHNIHKKNDNLYGVIVINGKQLYIGTICGHHVTEILSKSNGFQSGKHNKGGQSAQRFGRIYDNKINSFIKDCEVEINKLFNKNSILSGRVDGIILAGNGTMKSKLYKELKDENVKSLIIKRVNTKVGGKDGFKEVFQKLKNKQLFEKSEIEFKHNKSDIAIIQETMALAINQDKCDMISIGVEETIKFIKLSMVKYVVLAQGSYQYVIKKGTKPIKFIKTQLELHKTIRDMNITVGKTWNILGFMEYMKNLCRVKNVELKIVDGGSDLLKQFITDFSGCVGVLHQSSDYLNE